MKKEGQSSVHDNLSGFNIKISPFGQMETSISIDHLNEFLNENVEDKKLTKAEEE